MKAPASIFSFIFGILVLVLYLDSAVAFAAKNEASSSSSQSGIYRMSNQQVYSSVLGVMTCSALVISENRRMPGIFVSSKPSVELGKTMGLIPGMVLLTFDGYGMPDLPAAERWLRQRSQKPLLFTYAVKMGSAVKILSSQCNFSKPAEEKTTFTVQSGGPQVSDAELERECVDLINKSRRSEGLPAVQVDSSLARLAKNYTNYMETHAPDYEPTVARSPHVDLQGRGPGERAQAAGISRQVLENIGRASRGMFSTDKGTLNELHRQMMAEPVGQMNHRSTIMDPKATSIGVGITRSSNRFYLAEEFAY